MNDSISRGEKDVVDAMVKECSISFTRIVPTREDKREARIKNQPIPKPIILMAVEHEKMELEFTVWDGYNFHSPDVDEESTIWLLRLGQMEFPRKDIGGIVEYATNQLRSKIQLELQKHLREYNLGGERNGELQRG